MGATNFRNTLIGKDLQQAFADAQRDAAYWHGHGGYTGTIAEKDGYINLGPLPSRMSTDRLEDLIFKHIDWQWANEEYNQNGGRKPGQNPVPQAWRAFVAKAAPIYDDKWGPALVVEINGSGATAIKKQAGRAGTRDKVWVAMGWASE